MTEYSVDPKDVESIADERGVETSQADKDFDKRNSYIDEVFTKEDEDEATTVDPRWYRERDEQMRIAAMNAALSLGLGDVDALIAASRKIEAFLTGNTNTLDGPSD